ncbi:MAG: threonine ammonia-lyase, biosynthetic [gamma proteobacterium symbiont of Lucinoma myriamae]|nr:threonine ammonia-lyase, biosynthetic [gamma proteobacterium symbiont of Lucinoma myriamae]MCU7818184.1 threonine ammonia-lyase, biosynthetic [gamma proteobacterium symbiont of Lucinoma myriamae]MCU7831153.1 threonine ammonia-lyase, biosynthetic [gamma proteobacterium symbiont of Lucinoma myriamae]
MLESYVKKILKARVYEIVDKVPLDSAVNLSLRTDNNILLKREDLQPVFSFKLRGAYNKMVQLTQAEKDQGVIAASAGNHAQGVALSANKIGVEAVIVMPKTTPDIKVTAVKRLGGKVILFGNSYDEAYQHARKLEKEKRLTFIHPYDDPDVIAGQGTIAMEIMQQCDVEPEAIFVPVGGGGLIAGVAAYVKYLYPQIKIIGVEPDDAASMHDALIAKQRIILDQVGIFADGVAVKQVGEETFKVAQKCVDDVILVSADEICAAIKDIFDDTRTVTEPAGALAVAGLKKYIKEHEIKNKTFVAINSGANINFDRLRHVAERAELGENRELLFSATIDECPGSFLKFCKIVGTRGITEFNYRYSHDAQAHIFVGVKTSNAEEEKEVLFDALINKGYPVIDLSDNEIAKLHLRHMVGGHAPQIHNEHLYRFEFPERPGALLRFLSGMGQNWNISLFHYRNHGAAFGRVLAGIQVPDSDLSAFHQYLDDLGYNYWDETQNSAYKEFLG